MRRDAERLVDILDACERVARYLSARTSVDFLIDELFQDAIIRQLTIVGEAAVNLSASLKARNPDIPWQEIAGFRNRIVHDYFGFNLDTAWRVATVSLPVLRDQITVILAVESSSEFH